jgi:hypothetical protein
MAREIALALRCGKFYAVRAKSMRRMIPAFAALVQIDPGLNL